MADIGELITEYKDRPVAIYGLGTETERFLKEYGDRIILTGLLDGFREDGEIFGIPIIPLSECVNKGVKLIIVVARPGSCKAITKRIGDFCRTNGIELFDVRGRDLLTVNEVAFDFSGLKGESRRSLFEKIQGADVISFDLFDTLAARKVFSYTDVFEIVDLRLREKGIVIPELPKLRLQAEKELSKKSAPVLVDIYEFVLKQAGGAFISPDELAGIEWETDLCTLTPRKEVCAVFGNAVSSGKKVVITTDTYYSEPQIRQILDKFGLSGFDRVLVSCEFGVSKTQSLFGILRESYPGEKILHIGDDEFSDIEKAAKHGFDTFRLYSGTDLFYHLGGLGIEDELKTLSDRVKAGMFISDIFNSPFRFETPGERLSVEDAYEIGYLFCAPMITDFLLWLKKKTKEQEYEQVLFCARDGFLPGRLFKKLSAEQKSVYFLSSRTAAIRAGMEDEEDIGYVDSMKFSGSSEDALKKRFGISSVDIRENDRSAEILYRAGILRNNYKKYIENLGVEECQTGLFDFVAKGTSQLYLQRLFSQHIKGFYFLQLEPEFMADKGLDIEPFYSDEEKDSSAIFDNYYILETMLTAPYPQLLEFDGNGEPVFAKETRSGSDIRVFERAQKGMEAYFDGYIKLVPECVRNENKRLDEKMLALINKIQIKDDGFLALKVEDPFFGRMTDIRDVIG